MITAHTNKIYGIDWNWTKENSIITCGQDKSVKFWDISQPRICQAVIMTLSPGKGTNTEDIAAIN